jgi:hypothetical protein
VPDIWPVTYLGSTMVESVTSGELIASSDTADHGQIQAAS